MKRFLLILVVALSCLFSDAQIVTKYVSANLNLRSGPSTNYSVITTIPKGTSVKISDDCDCAWVPIEWNGYTGYVSSKYISNTKPAVSTNYYINVDGHKVQSPTYYPSKPAGATALCNDGTYSFSEHRRGTCSRHGGVAVWY